MREDLIFKENLALIGWVLCIGFMIWASIATSMITPSEASNVTTQVPQVNLSATEGSSINWVLEKVCVKVASQDTIRHTVSLEAKASFQIDVSSSGYDKLMFLRRESYGVP